MDFETTPRLIDASRRWEIINNPYGMRAMSLLLEQKEKMMENKQPKGLAGKLYGVTVLPENQEEWIEYVQAERARILAAVEEKLKEMIDGDAGDVHDDYYHGIRDALRDVKKLIQREE